MQKKKKDQVSVALASVSAPLASQMTENSTVNDLKRGRMLSDVTERARNVGRVLVRPRSTQISNNITGIWFRLIF